VVRMDAKQEQEILCLGTVKEKMRHILLGATEIAETSVVRPAGS
jgi:hypothetical protein